MAVNIKWYKAQFHKVVAFVKYVFALLLIEAATGDVL